jgi:predicted ATPase/DNA-binding CsgD family transcriptional regulator
MTAEDARLPAEFSSFIGRTGEVAELAKLLHASRAVTLCGAGGIGKTRLALRLLARVAGEFPDGVWFIDIGELRQPDLVSAAVAAAVGVDEEPGRPLTDTLAGAIGHRQAVLALDNCEHLIGACASLCRQLLASAPGLRVVATSREPLHVAAEVVWPVPPLALPPSDGMSVDELGGFDAIRLFTERASAAAPSFSLTPGNAASVARVCRALDGLPLAIELAAAWTRVLSAEQIADRLRDRLTLLTSADRGAPARQQTLRAAIDWSHDLLSPPEQVLLRRLSVFAEWSLDMAEQVCADEQLPGPDILDHVTALTDKSLLEVEPEVLGQARYRMLETVREYAADRLAQAREADKFRRLRNEYAVTECESLLALGMARVRAPWSARVAVFKRVDAEAANLREVLGDSLAAGDAETGMRLCTAILPVWLVRGTFAEGAGWLDGFLALPGAGNVADGIRGPALIGRAQLAMAAGAPSALELTLAGLELCWAAGDEFHVATALNLLTEIALHAGRLDDAAAKAEQALAVARSAGDHWNEGYALGTMATVAGLRGSLREAEELAEQALAVMQAIEQQWGSARTLLGLADLARLKSDYDTARRRYAEALGFLREINARPEIARCLAGLGRIAMDQGDLAGARQSLADSLRLSYASGSRIGMARSLEALARLAVADGQPDNGLRLIAAVTALRSEAGLPPVPGARTQRFLDAVAGLGQHAVTRLWDQGAALTTSAAIRLALGEQPADAIAPDGQAAGPAGPPAVMPDALTARERQVVALIAAGLSNREIGAALFISPATAARHVANILAKLGYTSRSQIAVWAASADPDQG